MLKGTSMEYGVPISAAEFTNEPNLIALSGLPKGYTAADHARDHDRFGAGSNSWLTGTASWMYFAATQYILGFRPDYDGIVIDPCIPDSWDGFEMTRNYRGTACHLVVGKRPTANAKVKALVIDGQKMEGSFIPASLLENKERVTIIVIY